MDISVSHAPSTFTLETHAVLMFFQSREACAGVEVVGVSSIVKIRERAGR